MNDILEYKLNKYHYKFSACVSDDKCHEYEDKLEYYDRALSYQSGGVGNVGNKKYIVLKLNKQVYQLLNIRSGTFNVGELFKRFKINQKPSKHSHITMLTFEIEDGIVVSGDEFNVNKAIDLEYVGLSVLPQNNPQFVVAQYILPHKLLLNITNGLEQNLVDKVINHFNKSLIKVRVESNNEIIYAYDVNRGDDIRKTVNTNKRYQIDDNKIRIIQEGGNCSCKKNLILSVDDDVVVPDPKPGPDPEIDEPKSDRSDPLEYLIPTPIDFSTTATQVLHRYYIINDNEYKEVLTIHHYDIRDHTNITKGLVHASLSNNRGNEHNTSQSIIGLKNTLLTNMRAFSTVPQNISKDTLNLVLL